MFSLLRISLTLGLLCLSASTAIATPNAEVREFLRSLASEVVRLGDALGDPKIVEKGRAIGETVDQIPSDKLVAPGVDRTAFPRIVDRFRYVTRRLPAAREAHAPVTDPEWPVADCVLPLAKDGDWLTLRDETIALLSGELAMVAAEYLCYHPSSDPFEGIPQIRSVTSERLELRGTCEGGGEDAGYGRGKIHVHHQGKIHWARVSNHPSPCVALEEALAAVEHLKELQEVWLGCEGGAYIGASYRRLEYLRDELTILADDLDFLIRFQTETGLQVWGGSRIADLYLPEALGGRLETVAARVQSAVNQTESAGYIIGPKTRRALGAASELSSRAEIKKAFDHYRLAYKEATAGSERLRPEGEEGW